MKTAKKKKAVANVDGTSSAAKTDKPPAELPVTNATTVATTTTKKTVTDLHGNTKTVITTTTTTKGSKISKQAPAQKEKHKVSVSAGNVEGDTNKSTMKKKKKEKKKKNATSKESKRSDPERTANARQEKEGPNDESPHSTTPHRIDTLYFEELFGKTLLSDANGSIISTGDLLAQSKPRLIGLYFSASWCGPCRQFTPILAEVYDHLKDVYTTNGLEIVLCGSDRDESSFTQYYSHHPWKAIPFESLQRNALRQSLNEMYNVRGIPSFVVLDTCNGNVVVPGRESPQEILNAVVRGDDGLDDLLRSWIDRIPLGVHVERPAVVPTASSTLVDGRAKVTATSSATTKQYLSKASRQTFQAGGNDKPRTVLQWIQAKLQQRQLKKQQQQRRKSQDKSIQSMNLSI